MKLLLSLEEASSPLVADSKGHGLHRLNSWGFDVPPAFIVSSDAYRAATSRPYMARLIEACSRASEADSARRARSVYSAMLSMPMAPSLSDALRHAWSELSGSELDATVSCRSSAIAEDSASASFAGQFATVLGVYGAADIEQAVRTCWASAWSREATAYRLKAGIRAEDVSMAVVIQRMVRADVSGVVFSVDPVTGDRDTVLVNSSWGLGEAIVSGQVTPDSFRVDRRSMTVTAAEVSQSKTVQYVLDVYGAVEEQAVDPVKAVSPSLTEQQAVQVAELAVRAEERAGAPQDMEWAVERDRIFVLQTRPITTL